MNYVQPHVITLLGLDVVRNLILDVVQQCS